MATEVIKKNIEAAYGDSVEVGRTSEASKGALVYLQVHTPEEGGVSLYFSATEKKGLDETIEALMRARRDAFGTKP